MEVLVYTDLVINRKYFKTRLTIILLFKIYSLYNSVNSEKLQHNDDRKIFNLVKINFHFSYKLYIFFYC